MVGTKCAGRRLGDGLMVAAGFAACALALTAQRRQHEEQIVVVARQARLDGAVKTARLVGHRLGNQLAPVAGYAEVLCDLAGPEQAEIAERINRAALRVSDTLSRLQRIRRFEETEVGGWTMLDLEASAAS